MYNTETTIAEYNTEESAKRAARMSQDQFPMLESQIATRDTSDEWVSRYSWGVTLTNGSYAEQDALNEFLYTNTLTR